MGWKKEIYDIFHITLDQEQIDAVLDDSKILQLIAGAGSGKTFTICCKVYYLVKVKHVKEEDILMISYTNFACQEIISYLERFHLHIKVITFHKFGLNLLKGFHYEYQINTSSDDIIEPFLDDFIQNQSSLYLKRVIAYMSTKHRIMRHIEKIFKYKYIKNKIVKQALYREQIKQDLINHTDLELQELFYQYKMKKGILAFQDMIKKANDELKDRKEEVIHYQYLMIDEFQDISEERFSFIQMYQMKTNCQLIVVGDDYQCIFQYADANVTYFIQFQKYFPKSKIIFLNTTYRNSQELLNYADKVIHKNQNQIFKKLKSIKHLDRPIICIYYKEETIEELKQVKKVLLELFYNRNNTKILVLGRYRTDFQIFQSAMLKQVLKEKPKNIQLDFLTIHQAKGLGYDEVILINLKQGKYGFPSTSLKIDIEEERRLFYVALTRTKNHIYLIIPKKNPSIFVEELFSGINLS